MSAGRIVENRGISRGFWLCIGTLLALSGCAASVSGGGDSGTDVRVDGACALPNGGVCPLNSVCPAPDGCNTCFCSPSGLSCTLMSCFDGGGAPDTGTATACVTTRDCPTGLTCVYEQGCNTRGRCLGIGCTDDLASFCGCDGQTFTSSGSCPSQGFVSRGPCSPPPDAGRDSGNVCMPAPPREIRIPRVMRVGQATPVMAIAPPAGCGCSPTIALRAAGDYTANVCGCCGPCACVDSAYAMGVVHTPVHQMSFPVIENVVAPAQILLPTDMCQISNVSIQNVTTTEMERYLATGPLKPANWIRVQGVISRCSPSDIVEVTSTVDPVNHIIRLTAADCALVDCTGPRQATTWEGWHYLSQVTSGTWRILDLRNRLLRTVTLP